MEIKITFITHKFKISTIKTKQWNKSMIKDL